MKPLILTGWSINKFEEENSGDIQAVFRFHFAWGKLPSPAKLASHLGPRTADNSPAGGRHWSDFASRWEQSKNKSLRDLSLVEFCQQYESIEL